MEGVCRMGPVPQGEPGTRGLETVMTSKSKEPDFCPTPGTRKHRRGLEHQHAVPFTSFGAVPGAERRPVFGEAISRVENAIIF